MWIGGGASGVVGPTYYVKLKIQRLAVEYLVRPLT
jgi:hypothetical protein